MDSIVAWAQSAISSTIAMGELHIWRFLLDASTNTNIVQDLSTHLSADEIARAKRFLSPQDSRRFVVCRGILRRLLALYAGCSPDEVGIATGQHGKPFLANPQPANVQFNLSHSGDTALFAFAKDRVVGIDVERIRSDSNTEEIAQRFFSKREMDELMALPDHLRPEGFFNCWTRKEAYVKATGDGLQISLDSFAVTLVPGEPPRLSGPNSERWSLFSFHPANGYVAAVVAEGRDVNLCFHDASSLFIAKTNADPSVDTSTM